MSADAREVTWGGLKATCPVVGGLGVSADAREYTLASGRNVPHGWACQRTLGRSPWRLEANPVVEWVSGCLGKS